MNSVKNWEQSGQVASIVIHQMQRKSDVMYPVIVTVTVKYWIGNVLDLAALAMILVVWCQPLLTKFCVNEFTIISLMVLNHTTCPNHSRSYLIGFTHP